jgi:hypothetical protein
MDTQAIIEALDNEIARLKEVKALLAAANATALTGNLKRSPGRPKKAASVVSLKKAASVVAPKKRKAMSPEARERIVAAQKARWAKVRKAAKKAAKVEAAEAA